jgi:Trk-type K+ transport system membrane component
MAMPVFGMAAIVSLFLTFGFNLSNKWIVKLLILDEVIAGFFVISLLLNLLISDRKWTYIRQSPLEFILLLLFIISLILEKIISVEEPHYFLKTTTSRSFIKLYFVIIQIYIAINGIISLTSFIALFIQKGFRLRGQIIVQEMLDDENFSSLTSILKAIVAITVITELADAIGLYFSWKDLELSEFDRIYSAVFHSVSAYCNAGFSIFPNGLETPGIDFSTVSLLIIMLLIVFGGLGFYTYSDMLHIGDVKMIPKRGLTLQTKMILITTLVLILSGALLVWTTQYAVWKDLPIGMQITNAFFLSITSRTAGFSTVSVSTLAIPTLMTLMLLMYIGGAPNSSSGGIKMTTMVTILASLRTFARGKNRVEVAWNTIPMRTVGLSRGITPDLTLMGRIMIILVMFIGRIGLFTFAVAMSEEVEDDGYNFPEINLMVG